MIGYGEVRIWIQCFYSLFSILYSSLSKYSTLWEVCYIFYKGQKENKNKEYLKLLWFILHLSHTVRLIHCYWNTLVIALMKEASQKRYFSKIRQQKLREIQRQQLLWISSTFTTFHVHRMTCPRYIPFVKSISMQ